MKVIGTVTGPIKKYVGKYVKKIKTMAHESFLLFKKLNFQKNNNNDTYNH